MSPAQVTKRRRRDARRYGFKLAAFASVECLTCGRPIGSEDYRLNTTLARFGQLFVHHFRCLSEGGR